MDGRKLNNGLRSKTDFTIGCRIVCIRCTVGQEAEAVVMGAIERKEKD